ncbi:DUF6597 domain-containing transcriptional factor [Jatrophihabitans sp. YIM 134969]
MGRDNAQAAVLDPARAYERITLGRGDPPAALAGIVDYAWWVTWHAPEPHRQEVIPRPVVHLVAEQHGDAPRLLVTGVQLSRFDRVLTGDGRAVALAFRPATFRPVVGRSVSGLRDRQATVEELFGFDDRSLAADLVDLGRDPAEAATRLADWLVEHVAPEPDALAAELAALVERAETDRTLTRAEHLAGLAGVGLRTLQRQFGEYVGVGPKWVVQRCRLLDVAAAAHDDAPVDWADLAVELGYSDQSHLIRAFTTLVGRPPATYAAQA